MRNRVALLLASFLTVALAGCATPASDAAGGAPATATPSASAVDAGEESPAVLTTGSSDADALAQAHAWLDAATLPPGAVPADASVATFSSYTGWPCGPVAELQAFWSIPDTTVGTAATWIAAHPTGDLISTAVGPFDDDPEIQSAAVGYIPEQGAQEGIVYTVEKTADGVAVRAEVAALTADGSCPELEDGAQYGPPGQG